MIRNGSESLRNPMKPGSPAKYLLSMTEMSPTHTKTVNSPVAGILISGVSRFRDSQD